MSAVVGGIVKKLEEAFGRAHVSSTDADREASSRDCWPRRLIERGPGDRALAVVWPSRADEVQQLAELCRAEGLRIAPLGAGSGVCGGLSPDPRTVVVDLKRLDDFHLAEDGSEIRVGAGVLGVDLERRLAEVERTVGHFPSSILCSTVGGWAATRGAGQCSGRYGKIEDMVTEVGAVLGTGDFVDARFRCEGPDLSSLLVGSEGTLGIITHVGLRLHPAPTERAFVAYTFPTFVAGQEALREMVQSGLRPAVARLYDAVDSFLHSSADESESSDDVRSSVPPIGRQRPTTLLGRVGVEVEAAALRGVLRAPGSLSRLVGGLESRGRAHCRLVLVFENVTAPTDQANAARSICERHGGEFRGEEPARHWLRHRYDVSFKQSRVFRAGAFNDTMEVAAPWSKLDAVYRAVRSVLERRVLVMAHISHCYPDGAAIYFTFVGRARRRESDLGLYDAIWRDALTAAVEAGAAASHHHGIGRSKAFSLERAQGFGVEVNRRLRAALDPDGLLNPGVLDGGHADHEGGAVFQQPVPGHDEDESCVPRFDETSGLVTFDARTTLDEAENLLFPRGFTLGADESRLDTTEGQSPRLSDWLRAGAPRSVGRWQDPAGSLLSGFDARLNSGERLRVTPAPRRAMGPDLASLFASPLAGRFERVTLAVTRRGVRVEPCTGPEPVSREASAAELRAFDRAVRAAGVLA